MDKKDVINAIRVFQLAKLALATRREFSDEAKLLILAQWSKGYTNPKSKERSLTVDWAGLGVPSSTSERNALWAEAADVTKRMNSSIRDFSALDTKTLSLDILDLFDEELEDEEKTIARNAATVQDAVLGIYNHSGKIIHRSSIEKLVTPKSKEIAKVEHKVKEICLETASITDLDKLEQLIQSIQEELQAVTLALTNRLEQVIKARDHVKAEAEFYNLPKHYQVPTGQDLVSLELNGFTVKEQTLTNAVLVRGSDTLTLNIDAWTVARESYIKAVNKLGQDKIDEVLQNTQPFFYNPITKDWNYTNIAIHLYNQLDMPISPQVLPMLFKDRKYEND